MLLLLPMTFSSIILLAACTGRGSIDGPIGPAPTDDDSEPLPDDDSTEPGPGDDDEDESAWLFDDTGIVDVTVTLGEDALASLAASPYTWVEADASFDGTPVGTVGFRLKGQNSFRPFPEKAAFKIDFDRAGGEERWGLDGLTFNNMVSDPSYLHEKVAYAFFRAQGHAASRAGHAWVTINGEPYGVYALIEDVDHEFLERWYEDATGPLWEVWDVDFYDEYIPLFQWESGKDDRTILQAVADALETPGEAGLDAAWAYVDRASFLSYWAYAGVVAQFDSWPYGLPGDDCHLYLDPGDAHLDILPHGLDEALADGSYPVEAVNGSLAARCLNDSPSCRADYHTKLGEALDALESGGWVDFAEDAADRIAIAVANDPKAFYAPQDIAAAQAAVVDLLRYRREALEAQLGPL